MLEASAAGESTVELLKFRYELPTSPEPTVRWEVTRAFIFELGYFELARN